MNKIKLEEASLQRRKELEKFKAYMQREKKYLTDDEYLRLFLALSWAHAVVEAPNENDQAYSLRDHKEELGGLHSALVKLRDKRGTSDAAINSIKRRLNAIPDHRLIEVSPSLKTVPLPCGDDFKVIVTNIINGDESQLDDACQAIKITLDNIKKPGKGGFRRQATNYATGIRRLADHFEEAQSKYKATSKTESAFCLYIAYWLNHEMKAAIEYPERHIRNALEH